ncbi:inositol monophosphatase [Polaribacter reichenbachii]|uniref:Inositol monophosphatase n=1 Tax=Polaribacter reichenbachii TaxID=996801 RepID=A0A1B8U772_9FLAO|nr:inositol monophosphatase family protein [Polaribacter reichenbachii]APZ48103.1 inositol monophosphatase [Polaribacter reichenbachii]AUC20577.1 inositol monophosphatase [Polaribacter reichenbachii]OBY67669.1 inositol monophosphatase [Polaribacter reichenbachii]
MDLQNLTDIAIQAALAAGKVIQKYMNDDVTILEKKIGDSLASQVLTEVDLKSEATVLSYLLPTCKTYDLGLLTEEQEDDKSRFSKEFFWCIDPIDGTLAFIKKQAGFSVSIALISKEGVPQIGVVFDPTTNNLYHAIKGQGAFKNRETWQLNEPNNYLTYTIEKSLTTLPEKDEFIAILNREKEKLKLSELKEHFGSGSVLNAIAVAENRPAIMFKFPKKENGGGSFWDYASTVCIFNELGLQAGDFYGNALNLNSEKSTYMNEKGIFFCNM